MNLRKIKRKAFTLLEVVIVTLIVGVLASLALPRFFRMIEYSRSVEALTNMQVIRQAYERCYLMRGGSYTGCRHSLDIEWPASAAPSHFFYSSWAGDPGFVVYAMRNNNDWSMGGEFGFSYDNQIWLMHNMATAEILQCGRGVYRNMGPCTWFGIPLPEPPSS